MNEGLFAKRLAQLGIKKQVDAAMIVAAAQKTINEKFGEQRGGDNLRVVSYRNGVLKIAASSNAWAAECQGIVGKLKKPPVQRVVFVTKQEPNNQD
jgi:hypothetical protein